MSGYLSKGIDNKAAAGLLAGMAAAFGLAYWIVGGVAGSLAGFLAATAIFWGIALVALPVLVRVAPATEERGR